MILISSDQSLHFVRFFATPWTAARQASLSITNSGSLLKLMSIKLALPASNIRRQKDQGKVRNRGEFGHLSNLMNEKCRQEI